jgi:hypothetical protein
MLLTFQCLLQGISNFNRERSVKANYKSKSEIRKRERESREGATGGAHEWVWQCEM